MNERIKELAEQAGMYIIDDKFSTYGKFAEKFAELIIADCLDILEDEDTHDVYGQPIRLATIRIKKLFGVEEPEEDFACPLCGEDSGTTCGVPGCQY